ncbi:MAG: dTMP kinase [Burkholderiales bacterium]|nr:dTMP kinase [Burkholderiales bacterium]
MAGRFITLEGIDGAGKSSHSSFIADRIMARGFEVITTREPGGTALGEKLRSIVLNEKMHGDTETLLMFASRTEQLADVILPALANGVWVLCDRFTDSTFAYQCGGRGLSESRIATMETWVHGHLQPDLTLLFDAPLEVARERLNSGTNAPDKFEREQGEFFSDVRAAYLKRAAQFPHRIKLIDSARTLENIRTELGFLIDSL